MQFFDGSGTRLDRVIATVIHLNIT